MVQLMLKKHAAKGHSINNGDDEVIIINSFDGAEAFKSRKNVNSVVSFSSSLLTLKMIYNDQIKAGESFNILTWSQAMGKETFGMIQKVLGPKYWERDILCQLERLHSRIYPNQKFGYTMFTMALISDTVGLIVESHISLSIPFPFSIDAIDMDSDSNMVAWMLLLSNNW